MIGSAVAFDLARDSRWQVTVADRDVEPLDRAAARSAVRTIVADVLESAQVSKLATEADLIVSTLPSHLAHQALGAIVEAGCDAVSVSCPPEDSRELDDLARSRGVSCVIDCGVAPGLTNMMVGHAAATLSRCERVDIYVGGVPVDRSSPFGFKAAFAPDDIIDEYVDPVRVVEQGAIVVKDALSEVEHVDVPGAGRLEAFLTDGLRTLTDTVDAPFMQEKTLRYPGHAAAMRVLRDNGLFVKHPVTVGGQRVRPRDVLASVLFPRWRYGEDEADMTVLRVVVSGRKGEERVRLTWNLLDRYDPATRLRSMARTTAFTATVVAGFVADNALPSGVHPPETIGRLGLLERVIHALKDRGVLVDSSTNDD